MTPPRPGHADLDALAAESRARFERDRSVLTFDEYYDLFLDDPRAQTRGTAAYALDCLESFGTVPAGEGVRFALFDMAFDGGRDPLVDHVEAQQALARSLRNFVRDGRISRFLLLHGPNGSAKTRLVECLYRALEHYSRTPAGALYRFTWVFPAKRAAGGRKRGFGEDARARAGEAAADGDRSYARLPEEEIEARLPDPLKAHPLLLLPPASRRALFERLRDEGRLHPEHRVPAYLLYGDLSARNRRIADTLSATLGGDLREVLRPLQVERFALSARYQEDLVTVYPQMHVDAQVRQLTMNQGVAVLPNILQNVELFEATGEIVDANRGVLEFDDLLKRPIDAFKYLLSACEANRVTLPRATVYLDTLLVGTSNDAHLEAFKQYPDFVSFKERFELIRMPYVRDYRVEASIYREMLGHGEIDKPIAPHTFEMAALWAVATRLHPPRAEQAPDPLKKHVRRLGPLEKAFLIADGVVPDWVDPPDRAELAAWAPRLLEQPEEAADYEGGSGISPREMKTILLNAAQDPDHRCLSSLSVFAELRRLTRERSLHGFLQREAQGDYFHFARLVDHLERVLLERVNREFLDVTGLVSRDQYVDLFTRYVNEASRWLKGEKVRNRVTGQDEAPDQRFMESTEARFGGAGADPRPFRERLVQRIAAYRIDHPDESLDYAAIFGDLFDKIRNSYFNEHREKIKHLRRVFFQRLSGEGGALSGADRTRADEVMARLSSEYGYDEASALETLAFLEARLYEA